MKPINKYIIVRDIEEQITTDSGLILSGKDRETMRYAKGKVIAPGTEVKNIATGDRVYYDKRQAFTMIVSGDPVTIIQERDVVVVE
jgi:co-chaperonin GroES (HSP10)